MDSKITTAKLMSKIHLKGKTPKYHIVISYCGIFVKNIQETKK